MKRFTDTDKFTDPWFRRLGAAEKLFWLYLLDNADNAGVWVVDYDLASTLIGCAVDESVLDGDGWGERVHVFDSGRKAWIPKLILFQVGDALNESSGPQRQIVALLRRHGLLELWGEVSRNNGRLTPQSTEAERDAEPTQRVEKAPPVEATEIRDYWNERRASAGLHVNDSAAITCRWIVRRRREGHDWAALMRCAERYWQEQAALKSDPKYTVKVTNFYGEHAHFERYLPDGWECPSPSNGRRIVAPEIEQEAESVTF